MKILFTSYITSIIMGYQEAPSFLWSVVFQSRQRIRDARITPSPPRVGHVIHLVSRYCADGLERKGGRNITDKKWRRRRRRRSIISRTPSLSHSRRHGTGMTLQNRRVHIMVGKSKTECCTAILAAKSHF